MPKTIHVVPENNGWAVKREQGASGGLFRTQKAAIDRARTMVRKSAPGQLVVHERDGRIREYVTYGWPRVQKPHGKRSVRIEKAVGKVSLDRLQSDPRRGSIV